LGFVCCDLFDEQGIIKEMEFLKMREVYYKYYELACRTIFNWHISERRKYLKAGDAKAAIMQDIEMRKWANDVSNVLNANIYNHMGVEQSTYEASVFVHTPVMRSTEWLENVNEIKLKAVAPPKPKEMSKEELMAAYKASADASVESIEQAMKLTSDRHTERHMETFLMDEMRNHEDKYFNQTGFE
jgi:hypothetical protein